jgi:hypothetical protein
MPLFIGDKGTMSTLYGCLPKNIHRAFYTRSRFPGRAIVAWGPVLEKWGVALWRGIV